MHYLIDGYNLLFRLLKKRGSLENARQMLITELNDLISDLKLNVTLVFDGAKENLYPFSRGHFDSLEIIYTHKEQSADEYIIEETSYCKTPAQLTVVTNDRELKGKCHQMYAHTMSIDEFLAALGKKKRKKKREGTRDMHFRESPSELARLLALFEKKALDEINDESQNSDMN